MPLNQSGKISAKYLKVQLEMYGRDIIITALQKKTPIACFRKSGHKVLSDS